MGVAHTADSAPTAPEPRCRVQGMNLRRRLPILAAVVMLLVVGCRHPCTPYESCRNSEKLHADWQAKVEEIQVLKPGTSPGIIIGIADDISGSAGGTGIPRITLNDLKPAIERIQRAGGEIALATISNRPDESLIRLRVLPPPILPPNLQKVDETKFTEETFKCLAVLDSKTWTDKALCDKKGEQETTIRTAAENIRGLFKTVEFDVAEARKNYKQWQDDTNKAIDKFKPLAEKLFTRPIEGNTDLCTPFNRFALFQHESSDWLSKSAVMRAVVLSTDGEETVRPGCKLDTLPDGTDLYLINCATPCALDRLKLQKYEAFTAALDAVIKKKVSTR